MKLPLASEALKGRAKPLPTAKKHVVNGNPLKGPYPANFEVAVFAMGSYWGAEQLFWQRHGVFVTAAGFAGGHTPNPTYQEVCTGLTAHAEAVLVVFDPNAVSYDALLSLFWENHNPTQGMRQGNDVGTAYRSAIYPQTDAQNSAALSSRDSYQLALSAAGFDRITTDIIMGRTFYFAEEAHQQYLAKNAQSTSHLRGTGVPFALDPLSLG